MCVSVSECLCLYVYISLCVCRAAVGAFSRCLTDIVASVAFCCVSMKVFSLHFGLSFFICLHQNKLNSVRAAAAAANPCRQLLCCHGDGCVVVVMYIVCVQLLLAVPTASSYNACPELQADDAYSWSRVGSRAVSKWVIVQVSNDNSINAYRASSMCDTARH